MPEVVIGPQPTEDGIVPMQFHGIPGLYIELETWRDMLVQFERDKGVLAVALARSITAEKIAQDEAKQLRASQKRTEWAATFGPWLGFAGGLTVAAIVAGILGGAIPRLQGAMNGN